MATIKIDTIDDALTLLSDLRDQDKPVNFQPEDIEFGGDLANLKINVTGERYHSSVPAELARSLWEFQSEMYRAVAFALYGVDNVRRLTDEDRTKYELNFKVTEGSTDFTALITPFIEAVSESIKSMESRHKLAAIIAVAIILATGWGAVSAIEGNSDAKKEEAQTELKISLEKEKTKQFEVFRDVAKKDPIAERFAQATEEGARAVLKGASDADSIKVGAVKFGRNEIQEANQRSPKERSYAEMIKDQFLIVRIEKKATSSTKIYVANKSYPEFSVSIFDEDMEPESLDKLWVAARNHKPIALEINITTLRNQIQRALLISVG